MSIVEVSGLAKSFGQTQVFQDISFRLKSGELVTLLGPSGCGKSTLLRCLAGLITVDAGRIAVDDRDITGTPAYSRGIGMVFQSYALFPNMTVAKNIAFGLAMQKLPADEIAARSAKVIGLVELSGYESQYPHQLSGGQRQRVALARALVVEPKILLLDEPLSALDARIRKSLRDQIRDIQQRLGLTTIFVTHDQEEALILSDRIFVMDGGRIVQEGTAESVYAEPASQFVARFMGHYNLLDGTQSKALLGIETTGYIAIRPESILLSDHPTETEEGIPGVVRRRQLLGNIIRYSVESTGVSLSVDRLNGSADDLLPEGAAVRLRIDKSILREVH
ncbi:ABC transporter ATP-binding protein [Telmatospirillum sp.]|uniref:ABC transporter ATP-binding protein n=1 Tax=Telmatospirillum sp. TaxID=2079197 RepID=UPI002851C365|nr:ABC transporter ATP-binding protein [Telmatospirillum sp.]MDR3438335.1 ABC transporter ATP-binding protein [Telmatospirillum sp.]